MAVTDVIDLVERALRADMTPGELAERWPRQPFDPYLAEVRAALEFAVEHIPGRVTDGVWRPVLAAWRRYPEYGDLELHLRRLEALRSSAE